MNTTPRKSGLTRTQWAACAVFAVDMLIFAAFASKHPPPEDSREPTKAGAEEAPYTPAQLAGLPMSPCVKSGMLSLADAVILQPSKLREMEKKCTGPDAELRFQQREALKSKP